MSNMSEQNLIKASVFVVKIKKKKGQKDNQWSTRHNTESWRLNNANTAMAKWLKTNNDLQNTTQQPED
jgi:hypothetical protein